MLRHTLRLIISVSVLIIAFCGWVMAAEYSADRAHRETKQDLHRMLSETHPPSAPLTAATLRATAEFNAAKHFGPFAPAHLEFLLLTHSLLTVLEDMSGGSSTIRIDGRVIELLGANKTHRSGDYANAFVYAAEEINNECSLTYADISDDRMIYDTCRQYAVTLLDLADILDFARPIASIYYTRAAITLQHPDARAKVAAIAADLSRVARYDTEHRYGLPAQLIRDWLEGPQREDRGKFGFRRDIRRLIITPAVDPVPDPAAPAVPPILPPPNCPDPAALPPITQ